MTSGVYKRTPEMVERLKKQLQPYMIGFHGRHSEENKTKWSLMRKGKKRTYYSKGRLGQPHTEETKRKISIANSKPTGRPSWNRGLKGYLAGKKHYNWKGGKGTIRHREMGRSEYILWRTAIFMRDDFTCQDCGVKGKYMEAHHIKSWSQYPELRYAIDNGTTWCKSCHAKNDLYRAKFITGGGI